jgi:hypothetical protein
MFQDRHHAEHRSARQHVLQALADDHLDIEHAVAQDRRGEVN